MPPTPMSPILYQCHPCYTMVTHTSVFHTLPVSPRPMLPTLAIPVESNDITSLILCLSRKEVFKVTYNGKKLSITVGSIQVSCSKFQHFSFCEFCVSIIVISVRLFFSRVLKEAMFWTLMSSHYRIAKVCSKRSSLISTSTGEFCWEKKTRGRPVCPFSPTITYLTGIAAVLCWSQHKGFAKSVKNKILGCNLINTWQYS